MATKIMTIKLFKYFYLKFSNILVAAHNNRSCEP